jgi:hypothetical protein
MLEVGLGVVLRVVLRMAAAHGHACCRCRLLHVLWFGLVAACLSHICGCLSYLSTHNAYSCACGLSAVAAQ